MKPITPSTKEYSTHGIVIARTQEEYLDLPAINCQDDSGTIVTLWGLTLVERLRVLLFGRLWLSILTFGKPLQPVKITVEYPIEN